jgi:hypothetical protein
MHKWMTVPGVAVGMFGCLTTLAVLSGCGGSASPVSSGSETPASGRPDQSQPIITALARCEIGEKPGYFVPGPENGPLALLGCARLGVSGKRVEFSGNLERIGRHRHLCVNPAYNGRGQRGIYIPAICKLDPPPQEFSIVAVAQPRQAVRRYALVVWGTVPASTRRVVARFGEGLGRAAVFRIGSKVARRFGESPFGIFVLELPLRAACAPLSVRGQSLHPVERIPPRPRLCERA